MERPYPTYSTANKKKILTVLGCFFIQVICAAPFLNLGEENPLAFVGGIPSTCESLSQVKFLSNFFQVPLSDSYIVVFKQCMY